MKAKAKCPASCGELLQGIIGKGEKLISYPIKLFSTVTIEEVKSPLRDDRRSKTALAMVETLKFFGEPYKIGERFEIQVKSEIPIGKGMASSTADVAAAASATAQLLGKKLTADELAKICVQVEPTDSTIFEKLTLFDHLKGIRIESFNWNPRLNILVLEAESFIDTQEFRKQDHHALRLQNQGQVEKAYQHFRKAYENKDAVLLGEAAIISAWANQSILPKKKLEKIMELSIRRGCYGVNVAHSGTVIGIIFEESKVEPDSLMEDFKKNRVFEDYTKAYFTEIVEGGVKIID